MKNRTLWTTKIAIATLLALILTGFSECQNPPTTCLNTVNVDNLSGVEIEFTSINTDDGALPIDPIIISADPTQSNPIELPSGHYQFRATTSDQATVLLDTAAASTTALDLSGCGETQTVSVPAAPVCVSGGRHGPWTSIQLENSGTTYATCAYNVIQLTARDACNNILNEINSTATWSANNAPSVQFRYIDGVSNTTNFVNGVAQMWAVTNSDVATQITVTSETSQSITFNFSTTLQLASFLFYVGNIHGYSTNPTTGATTEIVCAGSKTPPHVSILTQDHCGNPITPTQSFQFTAHIQSINADLPMTFNPSNGYAISADYPASPSGATDHLTLTLNGHPELLQYNSLDVIYDYTCAQ